MLQLDSTFNEKADGSGSYFFFQAEDGIRGTSVTGVQTCALPILVRGVIEFAGVRRTLRRRQPADDLDLVADVQVLEVSLHGQLRQPGYVLPIIALLQADRKASCRERV